LKKLLCFVFLLGIASCLGCSGTGRISPEEPDAHYLLGVSYLKEGNATLALKELLDAEKTYPKDPDIQAALGQAYHMKRAFPQAEEHYLRALEAKPDNPRIENNLGALYIDLQKWNQAQQHFQKAADNLLFTEPEVALTGVGFASFKKGEYLLAVDAYKRALEQNPRYSPAHFHLGEAYYALDRNDLAIASFQQALVLSPKYVEVYYQLGLAQLKAERKADAIRSFQEVIRLAPDSETARLSRSHLLSLGKTK